MFSSIRWRIAIPFIILIFFVMLGLGIYLSGFVREVQYNSMEEKLKAEAHLISEIISPYLGDGINEDAVDQLTKKWAELLDARVTIISNNGVVIGESHLKRQEMENHLNRPEVQDAINSGEGLSVRFSRSLGFELIYAAVPIYKEGELVGIARVSLPIDTISANVARLHGTILVATLISTVLAILIATIIAVRSTKSLRELTSTIKNSSVEELSENPVPSTNDEVGQLARAFNSLGLQFQQKLDELNEERSKLSAVLEQMTDGVLIVDNHSNVQLLNPAAERMFGISEEDALGKSLATTIRHHQLIDLWRLCRESQQDQIVSIELPTTQAYLHGSAISLDRSLPGNTLLLFQDLTEMRRLETIRRDFISNISHELRTPLASLKALAETLLEGALDDPPAARRFLQRMETEVDSLALMVQELLELSRIESGKVPLQLIPYSPHDLLSGAAERLWLQAERSGLSINLDCPQDLPNVLADPRRIEQVIVNLLHNAIKFSPPGGEILLSAQKSDSVVEFIVKDHGIGIPADDLPRIFERFYKTDRARSKAGTGLGLAISRHLIEVHNGQIWAESVEGEGSTFNFTLPVAESSLDMNF
jgi:two-component system phosphate regulon sensor histidine kinase PhoR